MLDDDRAIKAIDKSEMRKLLVSFPQQIADAWALRVPTLKKLSTFRLFVCGMGGSAIGGDLLRVYLHRKRFPAPVFVVRDYELPMFIDESSLVFAVSYSGNTEETVSAFKQALEKKSKIIALTSGGELGMLAARHDIPLIEIPKGLPPRTALGYLFMPLLKTVCKFTSAQVSRLTTVSEEVGEAVRVLKELSGIYADAPEQENPAKQLARLWHGKVPILYGSHCLTDVIAYRWKTQVNENAKAPAFVGILPELNHNETVGWENRELRKLFIYNFLRDKEEHERVSKRFELCKEILKAANSAVCEWSGGGEGLLARLLSLAYLGDWASFYLAVLYEVDPTPVKLIDYLKQKMGEDLADEKLGALAKFINHFHQKRHKPLAHEEHQN